MADANKVWTKEEIKVLLERNDTAVCRGLVTLFNLQTQDERNDEHTKYHNGVGFTGVDAEFLTSLARQYQDRGFLTPKQIVYGRKKILKYAGQLAKVANGQIKVLG